MTISPPAPITPEPAAAMPRTAWMDWARVIASWWVVTIHVAAVPVSNMPVVPPSWWWWAHVYNGFSRAAVPMFLMISGALLLLREPWDTGDFFKRRAVKLLPPMLAWTLLYDGWRLWMQGRQTSPNQVLAQWLDGLNHPAYPHLWFLWVIAGMYLLAPLLRPLVRHASPGVLAYFIGLWLVVTGLKPLIDAHTPWHVGLPLEPVTGFAGYFVIGAALQRIVPDRLSPRSVLSCLALFAGSMGTLLWASHASSIAHGMVFDETMLHPLSPTVMGMSLSAFLLIRHWQAHHRPGAPAVDQVVQSMALCSFGVFLIHPMAIDLLDLAGLHLDPIEHHPAWFVPTMVALVYGASWTVIALVRRTAWLRWLVP